ncbi:hypothetical protein ACOMHN_013333 [Nucella lapillus]
MEKYFSGLNVRSLQDWGEAGMNLEVSSATGGLLPILGWSALCVGVGHSLVVVPFLVTSVKSMETPILGYNAIHALMQEGAREELKSAFPSSRRDYVVSLAQTITSKTAQQQSKIWDPPVDLENTPLTEGQKKRVRQLLQDECDAFAHDEDDVGCIEDLELDIELTYKMPVQSSYVSIPPPMYEEVKTYLEDLKRRGWIRPSKSPYSSPMVCVRKKYGSLRLCIDYGQINNKTVKDSHPIPRIQDTLNTLGGKKWFSTLDQGKAYHQGFIKK